MKHLFFAIILLLISQFSFAQKPATTIYFEVLGPSNLGFNFDQRFNKKQDGLGYRIGFGGYNIDNKSRFFTPIGLNYLSTKDNKNFFEIGAAVTPVFGSYQNTSSDPSYFDKTYFTFCLGYRGDLGNSGFTVRAGLSPLISGSSFLIYYPYGSIGYKF